MRVLFVMFAFFKDAFLNGILIIPDLWEPEAAGTTVFKASLRYIAKKTKTQDFTQNSLKHTGEHLQTSYK